MKKWTVYYRVKGLGRSKSHGCESREAAARFIATVQKRGDSYSGLKLNGKDASPGLVLRLAGEAKGLAENDAV